MLGPSDFRPSPLEFLGNPGGAVGSIFGSGRIFMGFRDWSGGLGWEVVVPCEDMIQRRSALLALPGVFLLCIEVSTCVLKEVFQLVIRRSYIFIERLSVIKSAPRVCTV